MDDEKQKLSVVAEEIGIEDCIIPDEDSPWSCIYPACMTDDPDDGWGGCNGPCS